MENQIKERRELHRGFLDGFSPVSTTRIDWKSRKRSASGRNIDKVTEDTAYETPNKQEEPQSPTETKIQDSNTVVLPPELSERRKALFEPLEPTTHVSGGRPSNESLLPPPDFDSATYPRGWLIGKKRKLVNVDVVESMRRIAVQEMNRKDREIDELNEVLDEDGKVLEQLQQEVLEEKCKRTTLERENAMLKDQIKLLMEMLQEGEEEDEPVGDGGPNEGP
ncbi:hypothetical protein L484_018087 [Morus notabilis]|uniref:Protein HEADING DATE REPRESSOR 1 n=1 Tax=Morus notabilis TaxID=981085 RepID=W9QVI2_9ROSA|nr:protein HEADING DATE REPRESSOR 1 [Morus notabilis]EXB55161.1 hypothetical protein L484_018087 [Morus notabilis]